MFALNRISRSENDSPAIIMSSWFAVRLIGVSPWTVQSLLHSTSYGYTSLRLPENTPSSGLEIDSAVLSVQKSPQPVRVSSYKTMIHTRIPTAFGYAGKSYQRQKMTEKHFSTIIKDFFVMVSCKLSFLSGVIGPSWKTCSSSLPPPQPQLMYIYICT